MARSGAARRHPRLGGPEHRVNQMLANERKRTARFVPEIEIIEIQSGNDEGQIGSRNSIARS